MKTEKETLVKNGTFETDGDIWDISGLDDILFGVDDDPQWLADVIRKVALAYSQYSMLAMEHEGGLRKEKLPNGWGSIYRPEDDIQGQIWDLEWLARRLEDITLVSQTKEGLKSDIENHEWEIEAKKKLLAKVEN